MNFIEKSKIIADKMQTVKINEDFKSKLSFGNVTIMNTKHFNWLNKIMFKIFFGIKIEDYKEN